MSSQEKAISSLSVRTYRAIAELLPSVVFVGLPESGRISGKNRQPEHIFAEEARTDAVPVRIPRFPLTTLSAALTLAVFFVVVWWTRPAPFPAFLLSSVPPQDRSTDMVVQPAPPSLDTGAVPSHMAAPVSPGNFAAPIAPSSTPIFSSSGRL